jgi:ATP-dependent RNA helicase SUPV3L1/SUV3
MLLVICLQVKKGGYNCTNYIGNVNSNYRQSEGINRWSSTVEMANLTERYEIAIIDEIQMISDFHRGWAWTQALLGIQADEVHCCGESGAVELVKRLLKNSLDTIEVVEYKRLSGLTMDSEKLQSLSQVKPGDAVVAFSRKNVFNIKKVLFYFNDRYCLN